MAQLHVGRRLRAEELSHCQVAEYDAAAPRRRGRVARSGDPGAFPPPAARCPPRCPHSGRGSGAVALSESDSDSVPGRVGPISSDSSESIESSSGLSAVGRRRRGRGRRRPWPGRLTRRRLRRTHNAFKFRGAARLSGWPELTSFNLLELDTVLE